MSFNRSQSLAAELYQRVQEFEAQREADKSARMQAITSVSLRLVWIAGALLIFSFLIASVEGYGLVVSHVSSTVAVLLMTSGLIAASTSPISGTGFDDLVNRKWVMRIVWWALLGGFSITLGIFNGWMFAHAAAALNALAGSICGARCVRRCKYCPLQSTLICSWMSFKVAADCIVLWHFLAVGRTCQFNAYVLAPLYSLLPPVLVVLWIRARRIYEWTDGCDGLSPVVRVYYCMYAFFALHGFRDVCSAFLKTTMADCMKDDDPNRPWYFVMLTGLGNLSPVMVVLCVGRDRLFNYMSRRLDQDVTRAERDGAFMASLHDHLAVVRQGDRWWVHHGREDVCYPRFDPRRNWTLGVVSEIQENAFIVLTPPEDQEDATASHSSVWLPLSTFNLGEFLFTRRDSTKTSSTSKSPMKRNSTKTSASSRFRLGRGSTDTSCTNGTRLKNDLTGETSFPLASLNFTDLSFMKRDTTKTSASSRSRTRRASCFTVDTQACKIANIIPLASQEMNMEDMLLLAHQELRCIDWTSMTKTLFDGSTCDDSQRGLSRPVREGEHIAYFLSHSWHDDAEEKWQQLTRVAEEFLLKHGHYPTFWLDKVCIDQDRIADGLRVLPVNVMACQKVLALCGATYTDRLWCIWELCVLFSFTSEEQALERLRAIPLGSDGGRNVLQRLRRFTARRARCYDPNEQKKLLMAISSIGLNRFNFRIRRLAATMESMFVDAPSQQLTSVCPNCSDVTSQGWDALAPPGSVGHAQTPTPCRTFEENDLLE